MKRAVGSSKSVWGAKIFTTNSTVIWLVVEGIKRNKLIKNTPCIPRLVLEPIPAASGREAEHSPDRSPVSLQVIKHIFAESGRNIYCHTEILKN